MNGCDLLHKIKLYIDIHNIPSLTDIIEKNRDVLVSEPDFEHFISLFKNDMNISDDCININGSGGSNIPKLNISSLTCIYIAVITGLNVVKTGSVASNSLFGSSDLFYELGMLTIPDKKKKLAKYHFCYFDYTQLSVWKIYRSILSKNKSIDILINNGIFFDYSAKQYGIGIAVDSYYERMQNSKHYNLPKALFTFYTKTPQGIIDEITQGDIYLNDKFVCSLNGNIFVPCNKKEILEEDLKLLYGKSEKETAIESLRYSVAICLKELNYCNFDEGIKLFNMAYYQHNAAKLIENYKR